MRISSSSYTYSMRFTRRSIYRNSSNVRRRRCITTTYPMPITNSHASSRSWNTTSRRIPIPIRSSASRRFRITRSTTTTNNSSTRSSNSSSSSSLTSSLSRCNVHARIRACLGELPLCETLWRSLRHPVISTRKRWARNGSQVHTIRSTSARRDPATTRRSGQVRLYRSSRR